MNIVKSILPAVAALALTGCGHGQGDGDSADTLHALPDTLRVATLYSPTSYFIYREEKMGYDYTLVQDFCADKRMTMDLRVAPSLETALQWLDSGSVDLVAYQVPVTKQYNSMVAHCGPVTTTTQVLVQPRGDSIITDVTQLVGRDVYVEKNSKYQQRLENLNSELGGGIKIHNVDRDTLITEDLLAEVAKGVIPMTVVDSDIASLNKTYYPGRAINLSLSFGQKASWGVAPDTKWLADSGDAWMAADRQTRIAASVYKRYFEMSKNLPQSYSGYVIPKGHISPYDDIFRRYAPQLGWDWRLLASLAYVESRFDNSVTSWAGARGIMQIMPGTARAQGVSPEALRDPETSVRIAVKLLKALDKMLRSRVSDPDQRRLFVLAAYNAGGGHILDAIALASKLGHNPNVWHGGAETALLLKADAAYYNDPAVRFGYFRGRQTVEHVRQVEDFYNRVRKSVKK